MSASDASYQLNLLDLPVDILTLILRYLVLEPEPIALCPCSSSSSSSPSPWSPDGDPPPPSPPSPLDVFLAHPALHAIACPLFYGANAFELDLTGEHAAHVRRFLVVPPRENRDLPSVPEPPPRVLLADALALRRVRRLALRLDRLRGWVGDALVPLVADMTVHGSLTDLALAIHASPSSRSGRRELGRRKPPPGAPPLHRDTFMRPPVPALLSLLADPYLRSARLFVDPAHGPAWSRFRFEDQDDAAAVGSLSSDAGMAEVDWREVVREVDPEGREVPREWADDWAVRNRV